MTTCFIGCLKLKETGVVKRWIFIKFYVCVYSTFVESQVVLCIFWHHSNLKWICIMMKNRWISTVQHSSESTSIYSGWMQVFTAVHFNSLLCKLRNRFDVLIWTLSLIVTIERNIWYTVNQCRWLGLMLQFQCTNWKWYNSSKSQNVGSSLFANWVVYRERKKQQQRQRREKNRTQQPSTDFSTEITAQY